MNKAGPGVDGVEFAQRRSVHDPVDDGGRTVKLIVRLHLPQHLAAAYVQRCQCLIKRADIDNAIMYDRRGGDRRSRAVRPCQSFETPLLFQHSTQLIRLMFSTNDAFLHINVHSRPNAKTTRKPLHCYIRPTLKQVSSSLLPAN